MDTRRLLIYTAMALPLAGCTHLPTRRPSTLIAPPPAVASMDAPPLSMPPGPVPLEIPRANPLPGSQVATTGPASGAGRRSGVMAPIPNPSGAGRADVGSERSPRPGGPSAQPVGRGAIAAANLLALQVSQARGFLGGVQVFVYDPGRVYEVWTAPLRVTTLTLSRGEAVISKAAGDTVRWQIGETRSGDGSETRTHVMIKPLAPGLETNLVIATNRRIYRVELRSGSASAFNAAVTWDLDTVLEPVRATPDPLPVTPALITPQGPLDAGFRIRAKGRRPAWTPSAVATDGVRTFLRFPPGVTAGEAPALFARGPGGEVQLVNYRQQGALWVADRVLQAAELRMGGKHPQVVRIDRIGAAS